MLRFLSLTTVLVLGSSVIVSSKVYAPCELAQEMYRLISVEIDARGAPDDPFFAAAAQYIDDIPLMVCIAGYHNFTTDFSYTTRDGYKHEGIFGIVAPEKGTSARYNDDQLSDDFWALVNNVLYIGYYKNNAAHAFYHKMCDPSNKAKTVYCYLNKYVFGNHPVFVPKNVGVLAGAYKDRL